MDCVAYHEYSTQVRALPASTHVAGAAGCANRYEILAKRDRVHSTRPARGVPFGH